jgi:hypothetical protein
MKCAWEIAFSDPHEPVWRAHLFRCRNIRLPRGSDGVRKLTSTRVAAPKHSAVWVCTYELVAHLARATFRKRAALEEHRLISESRFCRLGLVSAGPSDQGSPAVWRLGAQAP